MNKRVLSYYSLALLLGTLVGTTSAWFKLAIIKSTQLIAYLISIITNTTTSKILLSAFISMTLVLIAYYLVKKIAPEAAGSGVQEIEGALSHQRPIYWQRLLPVKFFAGIMAMSAQMVVGREGPTIQMGGNLGAMLSSWFHLPSAYRDTLIAAGAAAGLASAFNAPLGGVIFILEEMRSQFNYSFTNFKTVAICCTAATVLLHLWIGNQAAIPMTVYGSVELKNLPIFIFFRITMGLFGWIFNKYLIKFLQIVQSQSQRFRLIYASLLGLAIGGLVHQFPELIGGGEELIAQSVAISLTLQWLVVVIVIRLFLTFLCYAVGIPGGVFAPILALGALGGILFAQINQLVLNNHPIEAGIFAVVGMGALFSACIQAPITGIVLIVEMTKNYSLILPLMISCLTATTIMQLINNPSLYSQLLHRLVGKNPINGS